VTVQVCGPSYNHPCSKTFRFETFIESSLVRVASEVLAGLGLDEKPCDFPYGSASKLSRAGVPSIVIGTGSIDQAHAPTEFVECVELEQAFEFYRKLTLSFV
jgi:acetylornithine deacetylase/succinyl-diaminopimelate desuccinylase-like protein